MSCESNEERCGHEMYAWMYAYVRARLSATCPCTHVDTNEGRSVRTHTYERARMCKRVQARERKTRRNTSKEVICVVSPALFSEYVLGVGAARGNGMLGLNCVAILKF